MVDLGRTVPGFEHLAEKLARDTAQSPLSREFAARIANALENVKSFPASQQVEAFGEVVRRADATLDVPPTQTWGRPETLAEHVERHGPEFGITSADEYTRLAWDFLQRSYREGLPTRVSGTGIIRVYDPRTNTFASFNPDGTTRTIFRPAPRDAYWSRQPGDELWE
jgi:pyocin large subunit-like protein